MSKSVHLKFSFKNYNFYQANIGPFHCHYSEITEHKYNSLIRMILEENFRCFLHLMSSFVLILVSLQLYYGVFPLRGTVQALVPL